MAGSVTRSFERPGRVFALVVLGLLVVLRIADPRLIATVRMHAFDFEQQLAPRLYAPSPVRIVAIDDRSLKQVGQWPWPRMQLARVVDAIAAGRPDVLGVDIIFAEPDRFSPPELATLPGIPQPLAHRLAQLPGSEAPLARALGKVPTVLGMGFSFESPTSEAELARFGTRADPRPYLQSYEGLVHSVPDLTAAARAQGVLAGQLDRDGIVRRVPLFVIGEDTVLPTLAIAMLHLARGGSIAIFTGSAGVSGVRMDGLWMPTDWRSRAYPYFTPSLPARYVSAADLLDGSYDRAGLRHSIVLLGVTGLGLVDQKQTPLGPMPGVEVTAQLIESILSNNLLRRPAYLSRIEIALLVAVGLLIIFAFPYRHPRSSAGILTAMVLGLVGFEYASFRIWHLLFDAAYPALASIVMFAVMLGASLRAAEAAQRRLAEALAHERESKALIEGELNAARTIQMGLLPRPFAGFPQRPELDVYAVVEPAQIVGGDLYDFAMLDDSHFFFAIADVSGKGVPAALFMAMSKEVLRAATLNFGEHLDQVFAEANRRISAVSDEMAGAGADMMFVTVFAGVIDLATGNLVHLNAGHHAPFVREPDGAIKRLSGRGGPPLGSVDGFRYDVETYQMTAGEMLLLYTDGLTEAENAGGTFYGRERLEKLLAGNSLDGAESLVDLVRDDVRHFVDGAVQADDVTLMALKWQGAPSPI